MPETTGWQPVALPDVSVQAWFSNDELAVAPGTTVTLVLSVHNIGDTTDSYTVIPAGLSASWTTVSRGNLTLFGGSQDVITVEVTPPAVPTTTAGPTVIAVRVIPQSDPDEAVVAEATLDVQPFDDRRIVALQPVQRARRRANYEFMVENHGNGLASCRLRLIDASNRVDGSFDPPAVGVAPGGASLVRLRAKARRGFFRRHTRTLDFEVEAEQQGHQPASSAMALVQPPTIPAAAIARVLAVAALIGALVAAWFAVIRPEIREAAEEQVDERIDELVVDAEPVPTVSPATTVAPEPDTDTGPVEPIGEPDFVRLSVTPALTQTLDASYTVPDGQLFDLTDVRIENAFNDGGVASLLLNGETIFVWSLQNIRGQLFEPNITEIRLQPGDNLTFSVRCDAIGDPTRPTCTAAVNLGGRLIAVDEV